MNLRTKTIISIATIEIVMLVVLVFSAMSFMGSSNEKQLIQRAHATATMFSHAIKGAVLTTDLATLDDLVIEILTIEGVEYVKIVSFNKVLSSGGSKKLLEREISIDQNLDSIHDDIFDTKVDIISDGNRFGHIEIGFSTSAISTVLDSARKAFIGIASLEVLLVALFSFILGTYLTRNLVKLKKAAQAVSQQGPGIQVELNQKDEVGEVAQAFNTMSAKLAENYKELDQARHEAESANEAKSRFLASMSHEIRTPMNSVLGLLASLQRTSLNSNQTELVDTATESGHLLLSLINNILDISKMEADNIILNKQDFDLNRTIDMVVNSCKPTAKSLGIKLKSRVIDLPPYIIGDETRFKQILLNLVGNALKFTEKGSVFIDVVGGDVSNNQINVLCKITDTGIGIAPESIDNLFDEFTMVDQTFSRTHEGSGLGLSICKRLVESMSGSISVESKLGVGSCFTFSLPFDVSSPNYVEFSAQTTPELDNSPANTRVLVAEDNRANQLVVKHLFEHIGLDIEIANNGREAVEKVVNNPYDIVFMDISMPEMDGIEACKLIRALEDKTKADLPIIAFTAHALTGDKEKFISAGMTNYLAKPVDLSRLVSMLNTYTAHHSNIDNSTTEAKKAPDNNTIVDEETLQQIIKDTSAETLPILIDHYIREARQNIEVITTAKNNNDYEQIKFEAHTLSSSSLALGNTALSILATTTEQLCINEDFDQASKTSTELIALAELSLAALQKRNMQGFE